MPSLPLFVKGVRLTQRKGTPDEVTFTTGILPLNPSLDAPPFPRVLIRRLSCVVRCPPAPGAVDAILDTGAPITVFPQYVWNDQFKWKAGIHYEECAIDGLGTFVDAQRLSHAYHCRIVRLKVPIVIAGASLSADRLRIDNLIAQLAEVNGPKFSVLGLWGGVFTNRKLEIQSILQSDEISASLVW
jgi:hypothetical protein